ncbi:glutaredoxin family protein [Rugamonas sp. CCM 8940]|uniref:glutaredoxin family protein n=1 Tax=Rugamonas sp. CCM 8940 TaxID=2765359 RepID=UPI0018F59A36|nr:glutaredoxin family protein [Rugamonas sp. CCM 8940]MBJ7310210.1 glutaredoxin family protein [Rugamonas sp. CCM 8940]
MLIKKLKQTVSYLLVLGAGLGAGYVAVHAPQWLKSPYTEGNYAAYFPDAKTRVVVYGTKHCPFCAKTRDYLRGQNIAFADFDIDDSSKAREEFKRLDGEGVPVILIGNRRIAGFNQAAIEDALKRTTKPGA